MTRDPNQLLQSIQDTESREYMHEAVRCLEAHAYKASVVTAFTAAMDDLRRKIDNLAASGGPTNIQQLAAEINNKFQAQEVFEAYLLDQLAANHDILPSAQIDKLKICREIRNKCAHPSGYQSSAEEALDVIASGIDIVLSKPLQFGYKSVRELLNRDLRNPLLFPTAWTPEQCRTAADTHLNSFNKSAHRYLITSLGAILLDAAEDPTVRTNALGFLRGAIRSELPLVVQLSWEHALSPLITRNMIKEACPLLIASHGDGKHEAEITRARIPTALSAHTDEPLIVSTIADWLGRGFLQDDEQQIIIRALAGNYLAWRDLAGDSFQQKEFQATIAAAIARAEGVQQELKSEKFQTLLDEAIIEPVTHFDWYVQNAAISAIQAMSDERAALVTTELQARYVYNIIRAGSAAHPSKQAEYHLAHNIRPRHGFLAALGKRSPSRRQFHIIQNHWKTFEGLFKASRMDEEAVNLARLSVADLDIEDTDDARTKSMQDDFIATLTRSTISELVELGKATQIKREKGG